MEDLAIYTICIALLQYGKALRLMSKDSMKGDDDGKMRQM
jgi:hypothetical protein